MLIHSHWTLSRVKRSSSPDWPSGNDREWTTKGRELMEDSNSDLEKVPLSEISNSIHAAPEHSKRFVRWHSSADQLLPGSQSTRLLGALARLTG
jgi:hypothetical protein